MPESDSSTSATKRDLLEEKLAHEEGLYVLFLESTVTLDGEFSAEILKEIVTALEDENA